VRKKKEKRMRKKKKEEEVNSKKNAALFILDLSAVSVDFKKKTPPPLEHDGMMKPWGGA
jgi:hypothetical protein